MSDKTKQGIRNLNSPRKSKPREPDVTICRHPLNSRFTGICSLCNTAVGDGEVAESKIVHTKGK